MKTWQEVPYHHPDSGFLLGSNGDYYIYQYDEIEELQLYSPGESPLYFDTVEELKDYFLDELDLPVFIGLDI